MRVLIAVALVAFTLDQATKQLVLVVLDLPRTTPIDIVAPWLRFVMAWNEGVNFGVLASGSDLARWALVGLSVAISGALIVWARGRRDRWFLSGAGLVVGGALGNALDRVRFGAVADFLNMSCCGIDNPYVFNVADVAIFGGAALLIWRSGGTESGAH